MSLSTSVSLLHAPGNLVFHFLLEGGHVFPQLPFIVVTPIGVFLVIPNALGQMWFCQGFTFPNPIPGCPGFSSVFLPGCLSWMTVDNTATLLQYGTLDPKKH